MMMQLWQVFTDPQNAIFSICLLVCGFVILFELLGLIIGFSNDWLDNLLPDALKVDFDVAANGSQGLLVTLSSWIYLGRIPLIIWLVIFFGGFGVTGIILQMTVTDWFGSPLIALIAVPLAFLINMFVTHFFCKTINPFIPKDETTAIELNEIIGLTAEIVIGVAKPNYPAQAKLKDRHGTTHYIMAIPLTDVEYKQGDKVIVYERVDQEKQTFTVISEDDLHQLSNTNKGS